MKNSSQITRITQVTNGEIRGAALQGRFRVDVLSDRRFDLGRPGKIQTASGAAIRRFAEALNRRDGDSVNNQAPAEHGIGIEIRPSWRGPESSAHAISAKPGRERNAGSGFRSSPGPAAPAIPQRVLQGALEFQEMAPAIGPIADSHGWANALPCRLCMVLCIRRIHQ